MPPHRKDQLLGRNPKLLQGVSDEPDPLIAKLRAAIAGPCSAAMGKLPTRTLGLSGGRSLTRSFRDAR